MRKLLSLNIIFYLLIIVHSKVESCENCDYDYIAEDQSEEIVAKSEDELDLKYPVVNYSI